VLPVAAAVSGAYVLFGRRYVLNRGTTWEERHAWFPGDDIVPGGRRGGTMAITIEAPPARVWSWLVQMGCDRGGWYSWDRLDNAGEPSARSIEPRWQHPAVGDRWASRPNGSAWFEVAALDPERFLALRAPLDIRGRPFDPARARPSLYFDTVWCFALRELPGERTRLLVSGYATGRPRLLHVLAGLLFWEPAHLVMQTRQLREIKHRAEHALAREAMETSPVGEPA